MRGLFDDPAAKTIEARRDTELTLGPMALMGIAFGLLALCGICFGLGFAMGSRGSQASSPKPPTTESVQPASRAGASQSKPSAGPLPPAQPAAADRPPLSDSAAGPVTNPQTTPPASGISPVALPQVRPALSVAPSAPPSAPPGIAAPAVRPALAPAGQFMVQIAAVSHPEDADVLINALRRRGYMVTAQPEASDGMIHVRIGPFSSRDEANQWRQKLLNDGYNAIVQP